MSITDLHPLARATGSVHGHHLHIGRATDRIGYLAKCSCGGWAKWRLDRRLAVTAFHRHLTIVHTEAA